MHSLTLKAYLWVGKPASTSWNTRYFLMKLTHYVLMKFYFASTGSLVVSWKYNKAILRHVFHHYLICPWCYKFKDSLFLSAKQEFSSHHTVEQYQVSEHLRKDDHLRDNKVEIRTCFFLSFFSFKATILKDLKIQMLFIRT